MVRITKLGILFGLAALFANTAEAASLFFVPATGEYTVGKEITVDLKINSDGAGINAAQATLRFPKDILTVKSVSKTDSILNFWLEEPTFSNEDGVISFVGGTPYGISGASLQVLHVVFSTKSSGAASINIADAAVTASDGSGTNLLSKTTDAAFTVSPTTSTPTQTAPLVVTPPTQITRKPEPASGLPTTPTIAVPLYTNPNEWSNITNVFSASWKLPLDISNVATAINKQPSFNPETSEGLFDSKTFPALADGVWYLHVRFKNTIGWGPTAHYRIAIDTKAPIPFEITSKESNASDNPTPTFMWKTSDALAGLREYRIKIDNESWVTIATKGFSGSHTLAEQQPGSHRLTVQAVDNAGNSIENTFSYETIALPSPVFTFTTETLYSDESKGLSFKGTALPSTEILLSIKKGDEVITSTIVAVDAQGTWEYTFTNPLRNGTYVTSIQNRDKRGARSLVVTAPETKVTGRYTNLVITLVVILITTILGGYWFYQKRRERTTLRIQVAESDTSKVFNMIQADIQKLEDAQKTPTPADDEFVTNKLKQDVQKMGAYIKDTISRARK